MIGKPAAFAASVVIHASGVVAAGHALSGAGETGTRGEPWEVEVELIAPKPIETASAPEVDAPLVQRAASFPTHKHSYPVPPSHDAHPHDPSLVHAPFAHEPTRTDRAPSLPPVEAAPTPAERFVLGSIPELVTRGGRGEGASSARGAADGGETTYGEAGVNVPARLVAGVPPSYPEAARAAEMEADVPVEIVVSARGEVIESRLLTRVGYGLDESAVRAVRSYRFSPAMRDGRAVRVRMRWSVLFRLR
jgi:protein TonB